MTNVTNKEILTAIANSNGSIYDLVGEEINEMAMNDTGSEVYGLLESYPVVKNQFIDVMVDKILKTVFYSKVFSNPLSMLHRGTLDRKSTRLNSSH